MICYVLLEFKGLQEKLFPPLQVQALDKKNTQLHIKPCIISAHSPVSLNLVDILDNLKRAGGGSVRIDSYNSISIDVSK